MSSWVFLVSSKFHCCSKHLSKRQTSHMRFVQDSGEALNAPVTSPLTAEWLFLSRPACNQWQKVTHTHSSNVHTQDTLIHNPFTHTHTSRQTGYTSQHNPSHTLTTECKIDRKHTHTHTGTHTHSRINRLGHNPGDEPYGTSIGSSITQSQKMAGSLCLYACGCQSLVRVYCMPAHI